MQIYGYLTIESFYNARRVELFIGDLTYKTTYEALATTKHRRVLRKAPRAQGRYSGNAVIRVSALIPQRSEKPEYAVFTAKSEC